MKIISQRHLHFQKTMGNGNSGKCKRHRHAELSTMDRQDNTPMFLLPHKCNLLHMTFFQPLPITSPTPSADLMPDITLVAWEPLSSNGLLSAIKNTSNKTALGLSCLTHVPVKWAWLVNTALCTTYTAILSDAAHTMRMASQCSSSCPKGQLLQPVCMPTQHADCRMRTRLNNQMVARNGSRFRPKQI